MACFICNNHEAYTQTIDVTLFYCKCPDCGEYIITSHVKYKFEFHRVDLKTQNKLRAVMKERGIHKKTPLVIYESERPNNNDGYERFIYMKYDELVESYPSDISERLERTLVNFAKMSAYYGDKVPIEKNVQSTEASKITFSLTDEFKESKFILDCLEEEELVKSIASGVQLTVKGWNKVSQIEQQTGNNKRVFVAMCFNKEVDSAYEMGIKKAVIKAGYKPIRIDKVDHNNKVDDEIIAAVKKCKFLIADFTGHRGGVYFEAGYALGLGKPVIWTCREDHLEDLHFDTRQYKHIVWNNEEELAELLYHRIEATID